MRDDRTERYEPPTIVRRERIAGLLLDTSKSDPKQAPSDVNVKANIRPVEWRNETVAYTRPVIADRTPISGFLTVSKSEPKQTSDVAVKDNIVPVRW